MQYQNLELQNEAEKSVASLESGLRCLAMAAKFLGIPADYEQLKRAFQTTIPR
jgi:ABC-type bacteriocin/lantibiotic exporter with double-glycine peptidase domain